MSSLFLMVTITDRRSTDAFLQLYEQRGVDVNLRTVGSGTAVRETLATLGLEKTEKAVLLAVVTEDTWKAVRIDLRRKMRIDVPGTGIAFTVPLSSIGGRRALMFLTQHQPLTLKEESTLKDTHYELLLVIANQGHTGTIMDAARAAGAGGGTVIHAKGTGMEGAAQFLGRGAGERKRAGAHRGPHAGKEPHHESHHGRCRAKGGRDRVLAAGDGYRRSASAGGRGTGAGDLCTVNNKM